LGCPGFLLLLRRRGDVGDLATTRFAQRYFSRSVAGRCLHVFVTNGAAVTRELDTVSLHATVRPAAESLASFLRVLLELRRPRGNFFRGTNHAPRSLMSAFASFLVTSALASVPKVLTRWLSLSALAIIAAASRSPPRLLASGSDAGVTPRIDTPS